MKHSILKKAFRKLGLGPKIPYQSFLIHGEYIEGRIDTPRMYFSFDLSDEIDGLSWLDLGCNEGSIGLLAKQDGASRVVGVELEKDRKEAAQARADAADLDVEVVHGDVVEYVSNSERFDVISLLAMMRHIHASMMRKAGYDVKRTGVPYLIYDSLQKLIQGQDNPVRDEFDAFISRCLDRSRRYFLCSINDQSGLILRRKDEVRKYFESRTDRLKEIEIYQFSEQNSGYIIIRIELTEQNESN